MKRKVRNKKVFQCVSYRECDSLECSHRRPHKHNKHCDEGCPSSWSRIKCKEVPKIKAELLK